MSKVKPHKDTRSWCERGRRRERERERERERGRRRENLGPVRLEADRLLGILEGGGKVAQRCVRCGSVAVEDVVVGIVADGGGVVLHGGRKVASVDCGVSCVLCDLLLRVFASGERFASRGRGEEERVQCERVMTCLACVCGAGVGTSFGEVVCAREVMWCERKKGGGFGSVKTERKDTEKSRRSQHNPTESKRKGT